MTQSVPPPAARLIVTNGDSAAKQLATAFPGSTLLPWRDMLHEGPVPPDLTLEDLSAVRARFLADDTGLDHGVIAASFAARDRTLRSHGRFEQVALWFEHDLYDQLQLAQILDYFALEGSAERVLLMQGDDYIGVQTPQDLRAWRERERPVDADMLAAASAVWAAFTASTPELLAEFAEEDLDSLPHLMPAIRRLLAELPAPDSGLGRTEELALAGLAQEPQSVSALFRLTQVQEPARFLGDTPFFRMLDRMAFGPAPLIQGLPFRATRLQGGPEEIDYQLFAAATVSLTPVGAEVLAGRRDNVAANGLDRWIGGTRLTPESAWRWDRTRNALLAP